MAKSYPRGYAVTVPADDWLSQPDAAEILGVSIGIIGWRIAFGHLDPAECPERTYGFAAGRSPEPGVTRGSVDRESSWQLQASAAHRWLRRLKDMLTWI